MGDLINKLPFEVSQKLLGTIKNKNSGEVPRNIDNYNILHHAILTDKTALATVIMKKFSDLMKQPFLGISIRELSSICSRSTVAAGSHRIENREKVSKTNNNSSPSTHVWKFGILSHKNTPSTATNESSQKKDSPTPSSPKVR